MPLFIKAIDPGLQILGPAQRFIFNQNLASLQFDNTFVPTVGISAQNNFETRNNTLAGFRWVHTTQSADTFGSLKLQSFINAQTTGTDILRFNQDGTVTFVAPLNIGSLNNDLDMTNHKIINLATPTNNSDATTKSYVDTTQRIGSNILVSGASQKFSFDSTQNNATFSFYNNFTPTPSVFANTIFEFGNYANNGFRLIQNTQPGFTYGTLRLQVFELGTSVADLLFWNGSSFDYYYPINMSTHKITNLGTPTNANDATNKAYIDNKTWTTSQITDFISAVTAFRLDQFAIPTANVNLNNNKLINVTTPTNASDGATKGYIDGKTWTTSQITDFSASVTAFRLDQFAIPTADINLNNHKIINLSSPTNASDAATKAYVDAAVGPGANLTLQGDVTGSGPLTSPVVTTLNKTLNQISNAGDINIGNHFIFNLNDPTQASQAATKNYVDSRTWTTSQITNFNSAVLAF
jgi:hypothetical protein